MSFADEFKRHFDDVDGVQWIEEAEALAARLAAHATIESTFDHALLVGDRFCPWPARSRSSAMRWAATRRYLGEVEGCATTGSPPRWPSGGARARGWFEHVLISQPAHQPAWDHIQKSYGGRTVLHHVALTVSIPGGASRTGLRAARHPGVPARARASRRDHRGAAAEGDDEPAGRRAGQRALHGRAARLDAGRDSTRSRSRR